MFIFQLYRAKDCPEIEEACSKIFEKCKNHNLFHNLTKKYEVFRNRNGSHSQIHIEINFALDGEPASESLKKSVFSLVKEDILKLEKDLQTAYPDDGINLYDHMVCPISYTRQNTPFSLLQ